MSKKLVIARMPVGGRDCLAILLQGENGAEEFFLSPETDSTALGNIYVAKVAQIMENIGAAFLRLTSELIAYMPLSEASGAVFKTRKKDQRLRPGDELLVQVEKEALKTKLPRATANLHIPGKYLVLTTGDRSIGFSRRLTGEEKQRLKRIIPRDPGSFGMIVRTNAREADDSEILEEHGRLTGLLRRICTFGVSRTCGSCLYEAAPGWIRGLSRIPVRDLSEIVTDVPSVRDSLQSYLGGTNEKGISLKLYGDPLLPLRKLFSMESLIDGLLREKVWLKSGGFLVIQQTEAFAAVDVNSGKYSGKKDADETFHLINMEAAAEAARQIRLRQLSGVILIDFINMKNQDFRRELLSEMRRLTAADPVKTTVVDMTALDIMEITRQKERRSLQEQVRLLRDDPGKENSGWNT